MVHGHLDMTPLVFETDRTLECIARFLLSPTEVP
jgi:hypothetical protein